MSVLYVYLPCMCHSFSFNSDFTIPIIFLQWTITRFFIPFGEVRMSLHPFAQSSSWKSVDVQNRLNEMPSPPHIRPVWHPGMTHLWGKWVNSDLVWCMSCARWWLTGLASLDFRAPTFLFLFSPSIHGLRMHMETLRWSASAVDHFLANFTFGLLTGIAS